jgi:hypothetical protein
VGKGEGEQAHTNQGEEDHVELHNVVVDWLSLVVVGCGGEGGSWSFLLIARAHPADWLVARLSASISLAPV